MRMKETNVSKDVEENNIRVVETPFVENRPAKPHYLKILALALLGGSVLGCGLVVGIDMADRSIRSVNDVEEALGLPVLTFAPRSKRTHLDNEPLVTTRPRSHESESFRS